ncbi:MAG: hypothetical protein AAGG55_13900, partial [Pseudomonadota bacterium]
GASTTTRKNGSLDNLKEYLDGEISDFMILDRPLTPGEVLFLAEEALEVEMPSEDPGTAGPTSAQVVAEELYGTAAGETLEGGDGDDWLFGDDGNDVLIGGEGQDTFAFAPWQGNDVIMDFNPEEDLLALRDGMQIGRVRAFDGDGDGLLDDTLISFAPGDSVTLIDVLVTEDDLTLI